MKKLYLLFLFFVSEILFSQNYYHQFLELMKENDTVNTKKILLEWEKVNNNDPEFYVAAVNFYFNQSQEEVLSLTTEHPKSESLTLKDETGKTAGYIGSSVYYKSKYLKKTFWYFDEAIKKFPNRLDIRFGKIYSLEKIGDYENFTKEIISAIEYSKVINNQWLWSENKKYDDGKKGFLGSIQDYINQLFNTNNDALLKNMRVISEEVLKHYPNEIEFVTNIGTTYLIENNMDKALEYLLSAEKINNKDYIVLNNIGRAYEIKGDTSNAIKYYELTEKYGDEYAKEEAKKELKKLNK